MSESVASDNANALGAAIRAEFYQLWAWLGVGWIALMVYVWGSWIASGDAVPIAPQGLTEADGWRVALFRVIEVSGVIAGLAMLAWFVLRPWLRDGRLSDFGLMLLVFPFLWFQDPLVNMFAPSGVITSVFNNYGSWTEYFPLTVAPNVGRVPEAFPFMPCIYVVVLGGSVLLSVGTMNAVAVRSGGKFWPIAFAGIASGIVYDIALEVPAVWLEIWGYPGAIRSLSLWAGTRHQFPIYEMPFLGITEFLWASMLFFRNARGELPFEVGISGSRLSGPRRTGVRYLALFGALQSIFFVVYFIPWNLMAMHADPWPTDFPAHMVNGICGPGTDYVCPGNGIPLLRGDEGLVITPEGELVGEAPRR